MEDINLYVLQYIYILYIYYIYYIYIILPLNWTWKLKAEKLFNAGSVESSCLSSWILDVRSSVAVLPARKGRCMENAIKAWLGLVGQQFLWKVGTSHWHITFLAAEEHLNTESLQSLSPKIA